jgi:hypothetical protein
MTPRRHFTSGERFLMVEAVELEYSSRLTTRKLLIFPNANRSCSRN